MTNTKTKEALMLNLQLFADGEGDGAAAAPGADSAPDAGEQAAVTGAPAAAQQEQPVDLDAEFEELIKGKYKAQFDKRTSKTVQSRLRQKDASLKQYKEFADRVADKFGYKSRDIKDIAQAFEAERRPGLAERAAKNGVDEDFQDYVDKLEERVNRAENLLTEKEEEEQLNAKFAEIVRQSEALKQTYPRFDLQTEMQNEDFMSLIDNGVPVESAFWLIHREELTKNAMAYTAQQVENGVMERVRANGTRPVESGARKTSAVSQHIDPSKLTDKQIDEYIERMRRGEKITFR